MLYSTVLCSQLFQALLLFTADGAPLILCRRGRKTSCQPTEAIIDKFALFRKPRRAGNTMKLVYMALQNI